MNRCSLSLLAGVVAAAAVVAVAGASTSAGPHPRATVATPVPSLTPAATERLWRQLVGRPRARRYAARADSDCRPLRSVFYAATDWLRLATKLAATPSPCADYAISVPPLTADKSQPRADQAWRIRALGPAFHALAEINVAGWTTWVTSTGNSWYAAGVEARRRMALAGYDVAAGDTWAVNELSSAVRQGVGSARVNMRSFVHGLYDGDGTLPAARGAVFITGIGQETADLSIYQARLQDWYEDEPFWADMSSYVSDWSQELYGDVRNYAVPGAPATARRDSLNEYLQHQASLAAAAPAPAAAARAFLAASYDPLANAAWQYDASFGWTDVPVDLMEDYVSAQTYAARSAGASRFGFAWAPKNPTGLPAVDFAAQTDALVTRLAAAIADSSQLPEAACGTAWCNRELAGAAFNPGWRSFAAWSPSQLAFTTAPQTLLPGLPSGPLTVELRTSTGVAYTTGLPLAVQITSSSPTGELSASPLGPWAATLAATVDSGAAATSFYFRDQQGGSPTITAAAAGKTAATQTESIVAPPPPVTPPPAPVEIPVETPVETPVVAPPAAEAPAASIPAAPAPAAGGGGGGGGGGGPNLAVALGASPQPGAVGDTFSYVATLSNRGAGSSSSTLTVSLPAAVSFASSKVDRGPGCSVSGQTLTCPLDFFPPGLAAQVVVGVTVRSTGTLVASASVSSDPGDADPGDDAATLTLVVAPPTPPLPPSPQPARAPASSGGRKTLRGTPRSDRLVGTARRDVLRGLGGNDSLLGLGGDDVLEGGTGVDRLAGGAGNDTIRSRDGARDAIDCGPGRDLVVADRKDTVARNCETVRRR